MELLARRDMGTVPLLRSQVSFDAFAKWWNEIKEATRRATRRAVKEAFELIDRDKNGKLDKEEFGQVCSSTPLTHQF